MKKKRSTKRANKHVKTGEVVLQSEGSRVITAQNLSDAARYLFLGTVAGVMSCWGLGIELESAIINQKIGYAVFCSVVGVLTAMLALALLTCTFVELFWEGN